MLMPARALIILHSCFNEKQELDVSLCHFLIFAGLRLQGSSCFPGSSDPVRLALPYDPQDIWHSV